MIARHLKAENPNAFLGAQGGAAGNIERQCGLAHRGSGRDHHQVGGLEPGGQLVEPGEPRGNPRYHLLLPGRRLDLLESGLGQLAEADKAGPDLGFGDVEDRPLGAVQHVLHLVLLLVAGGDDLVGLLDQSTQGGFFLHDAGVVLQVGQAGDFIDQRRYEGTAANGFQLSDSVNGIGQGHQVNGLGALQQRHHLLEECPVAAEVEVLVTQQLDRLVNEVVVQQDGSQNATLGLDVPGKSFFDGGLGRHGSDLRRNGDGLPGKKIRGIRSKSNAGRVESLLFPGHFDVDHCSHFSVEFDGHVVPTQRLEGLLQVDLPAVDLKAFFLQ